MIQYNNKSYSILEWLTSDLEYDVKIQHWKKHATKVEAVKWAVLCAESIQHLNNDARVQAAIDAAKAWLKNPCQETINAARIAAHAASYAAYAAAYAAYAAAYAAYTAAAYDATYVDYAASVAASVAAHAAKHTSKQQVLNLLISLYIEAKPRGTLTKNLGYVIDN